MSEGTNSTKNSPAAEVTVEWIELLSVSVARCMLLHVSMQSSNGKIFLTSLRSL